MAFSVACESGSNQDGVAPRASTPADAAAIRGIDLTKAPPVLDAIRRFGGEVDRNAVIYADFTGDGRDDAAIPITSGGTLGNLAYVVVTFRHGDPTVILTRTRDRGTAGGLQMTYEDGTLVETTGEYGPEDPFCCPSVLRRTYFRWDGSQLQVEREEKVATAGIEGKQ